MDQDQKMPETSPTPGGGGAKSLSTMIIVAVLVVAVLAVLGMVMMQRNQSASVTPPAAETAQTPAEDPATTALSAQGSSDEVTAIDADLKATDLNSLNDVNTL